MCIRDRGTIGLGGAGETGRKRSDVGGVGGGYPISIEDHDLIRGRIMLGSQEIG